MMSFTSTLNPNSRNVFIDVFIVDLLMKSVWLLTMRAKFWRLTPDALASSFKVGTLRCSVMGLTCSCSLIFCKYSFSRISKAISPRLVLSSIIPRRMNHVNTSNDKLDTKCHVIYNDFVDASVSGDFLFHTKYRYNCISGRLKKSPAFASTTNEGNLSRPFFLTKNSYNEKAIGNPPRLSPMALLGAILMPRSSIILPRTDSVVKRIFPYTLQPHTPTRPAGQPGGASC